jgi:hypothetical protein
MVKVHIDRAKPVWILCCCCSIMYYQLINELLIVFYYCYFVQVPNFLNIGYISMAINILLIQNWVVGRGAYSQN